MTRMLALHPALFLSCIWPIATSTNNFWLTCRSCCLPLSQPRSRLKVYGNMQTNSHLWVVATILKNHLNFLFSHAGMRIHTKPNNVCVMSERVDVMVSMCQCLLSVDLSMCWHVGVLMWCWGAVAVTTKDSILFNRERRNLRTVVNFCNFSKLQFILMQFDYGLHPQVWIVGPEARLA